MLKQTERSLRSNGLLSSGEDVSRVSVAEGDLSSPTLIEGEPAPSSAGDDGQVQSSVQSSKTTTPVRTTVPPTSGVRATAQRPAPAPLAGARMPGWSWILKQVSASVIGLAGCPARVQEEARRLAREAGERALCRFERLTPEDRDAIIAAALDRFCHRSPVSPSTALGPRRVAPWEGNPEPYFRHAVRCEAIALTERRFQDVQRGDGRPPASGELDPTFLGCLDQARRRTHLLQGVERRVFFASAALDSVAAEHEVFKVALYTAIALKLRLNSVHKHMSRARQKLFNIKGREAIEWADAWKYLEPPSDDLAQAARAYLAACRARGTGDAVVRWAEAHDEHRQRFNVSKEQSARALAAWRAFVEALDASRLRPRDVGAALLNQCVDLGIDHRVIEAKIKGGQTWLDLLINVDVKRPSPDERAAWRGLLRAQPFGAEVDERFLELEERSTLADQAKSALNQAYKGFLEAASQSPDDLIRKRDEFLNLVDAVSSVARG